MINVPKYGKDFIYDHNHLSNMTPEQIKDWAHSIAYQLDEPSVLTINEITSKVKDWSDPINKLKFCLMLPVPYSGVIANLGASIIYDELNRRAKGVIAERCYFPEKKLLVRLKKHDIPLFSKETFVPLQNFDVVGFSSFYPVQFLNFEPMLEMGGIPVLESERDGVNAPIVIGGGVSFFNPEPVYGYFDAIFIGEAEKSFVQALRILEECKLPGVGIDKEKLLYRWAKETPFMYVPKYYDSTYFSGFGVKERFVLDEYKEIAKPTVMRATADIHNIKPSVYNFVPVTSGGAMSVGSQEVGRGCSAMCRFCEGAYRTYPYRERPYDMVVESFEELMANTGVKDVTPYAFNLSDYSHVRRLMGHLLKDQDTKIQMSSQRVDMFDESFARMAYISGNRSITLAVEAGSQHMRNVINKNLTEEQILEAFESAFKIGFNKIKVYMIANLPFETEEDIVSENDSTVALMKKIAVRRDYWAKRNGKKCQLTFSYTPFTSKNGCLIPETYVLTDQGIKTLGDFDNTLHNVWNGNKVTSTSAYYASNGGSPTPTVKITLSNGQILEGTLDHPLQADPESQEALLNNGYVRMSNLELGSQVKRSLNTQLFGTSETLSIAEAYLHGFDNGGWQKTNTRNTDDEILTDVLINNSVLRGKDFERISKFIETYHADSLDLSQATPLIRQQVLVIKDTDLIADLEAIYSLTDGSDVTSTTSTIPAIVLSSTKEIQRHFVSGVLEANAIINSHTNDVFDPYIWITSNSRAYLEQLNLILSNFGIDSAIRYSPDFNSSLTKLWALEIIAGCSDYKKIRELFPLYTADLSITLDAICAETFDNLVHSEYLTVTEIGSGNTETFCITVPDGAKFIANGVESSNTPFQYAECMGALNNKRTLTEAVEEARRLGIKFRVGTSQEISVIAQVLTLGDRRLFPVIRRAINEGVLKYFGGMSVGKDILGSFQDILLEETGHGYQDYMGEKKLNQIFPWDFIDLGTTKEFLKEQWLSAKSATAQEDTFGCFNRCSSCRACHTFADVLPSLDNKDYLVTSWHKKQKEDASSRIFVDIINKARKDTVQKFRIKIFVDESLRYLDRSKVKLYINRAFIRTKFPARNNLFLASDKIRFQNWSYGVDYASGNLTETQFENNTEWINKLNKELIDLGIRVDRLEFYTPDMSMTSDFAHVLYQVTTDYNSSDVAAAIERFKEADELIVKLKKPGMDKGLWETVETDVKPFIGNIWYEMVDGKAVIRSTMSERVSPYEIFPTLFKTSAKAIKRYPVQRVEYLKKVNEFEMDLFAEVCEVSGEEIEQTVLGEPVSDRYSVRHLPFEKGFIADLVAATSDAEMDKLDQDADDYAKDVDVVRTVDMQNAGDDDQFEGLQ